VPVDLPLLERLRRVGVNAQIAIDLDAFGKLTRATVLTSSGRERLDRSALDRSALEAVGASIYRAERIDGHPVSGRYIVNVALDPAD
jgi:TonB family protein